MRVGVVALLALVALGVAVMSFSHQTHAAPALPGPPSASGGRPASGPPVAISSPVSMITSDALEYWTPAKMKAAHFADLPTGKKATTPPAPSKTIGSPGIVDPVPPDQETRSANLAPEAAKKAQTQSSTVAYPYTTPYSAVGKVFFTDPKTNTDYVCSGTAVASTNSSTIDTAGHCVANGGKKYFYKNWVFCAQYHNGCDQKYLWPARRLVTHRYWYQSGMLTYDYGEAVVNPNESGNVTDAVGGAGVAYNQSYQQQYVALGFPQAAPFNGQQMQECQSGVVQHDQPNPKGSATLSITCNMTAGASGGGWLITYNGKFGYLNGHNDYKYTNDQQHMYSPYYGSDWYSVYTQAQGE